MLGCPNIGWFTQDQFKFAVKAGLVNDENIYEDVKTALFFRAGKKLLQPKKLAKWQTDITFAEKSVHLSVLAKSAKDQETTDIVMKIDSLLPSDTIIKHLKLFFFKMGHDEQQVKEMKICAVKRVVLIVFATNGNDRSRDDTICVQFTPSFEQVSVDETKSYLKESNLETIEILRKETRIIEKVKFNMFSIEDNTLYLRKLCPCVREEEDDDYCVRLHMFDSTALCCKEF